MEDSPEASVLKCKALKSAFTQDFSERTSGQYTFKETTHDTVARFIEWTYRGDYSEDELTPMNIPHAEKPDLKSPQSGLTSEENKTLQAHTPLCHLRVYIQELVGNNHTIVVGTAIRTKVLCLWGSISMTGRAMLAFARSPMPIRHCDSKGGLQGAKTKTIFP